MVDMLLQTVLLFVSLTCACSSANPPSAPEPPVQVAPTDPGAVFAPGVAFDEARNRLVVFGGEGANRSLPTTTWEWDGTSWRSLAAAGPSGRFWAAMAYDTRRQRVVLFGGAGSGGALGDTWEYNGTAWTQFTSAGPSARFAHEMVYDHVRSRVVLFGGTGPAGALGDSWEWDGAQWRQLSEPGPSPRFAHGLAFDIERGRRVVFAGHGPLSPGATTMSQLSDTWTFGSQWSKSTAESPSARDGFSHLPTGGPRVDRIDRRWPICMRGADQVSVRFWDAAQSNCGHHVTSALLLGAA